MAYLQPDKIIAVKVGGETIKINQKIIPKGNKLKPNKLLNSNTGTPKGITIHNTEWIETAADTNPAEQYSRATYNGNMGGVVVHFYVYQGEIWQLLNENEQGWHAADTGIYSIDKRGGKSCGNYDTIAIECIGDNSASEHTTALLAAYLLNKHGLQPDKDLYTHNYWYKKKYCPAYILPHWERFATEVAKAFESLQSAESKKVYRVQVGAFSSRENAERFLKEVKAKGLEGFIV